jgi:anaerobic magnesium-protoporphyrin IX monomethyl ester cyclase
MIDCLIVGFNEIETARYVRMVRSMGTESGAWRDLNLALLDHRGELHHALEVFADLHHEGRPGPRSQLHNADFLWPTILYLGSYLQRRGFTFDYVNLFAREKEEFRSKVREHKVLTVAITTTLYVIPEPILDIVEFVRREDPNVRIIVGGPYVSNNTGALDDDGLQRFFKLIGADFYVDSSEGEETLARLLGALKCGGDVTEIPNLAFHRGDNYVTTQKATESSSLAEEAVRYELFPRRDIGAFVSLRTAKSCPFSCAFCGFPARAGHYVVLDVERVAQELDAIRDQGVTTLTFLDDTFNVPKKRFRELLRMMIDRRYGFRWNSFYRSDHGDAATIALMAEAGCEGVFLGIESGSDSILQAMRKTSRRRHYLEAIPLFRRHGILTHANMIVGFPGETHETFLESVSLVEEAQPDFYRAQLWYADPVTPVWQRRDELGIIGEAFSWSHRTMDSATASDLVEKMFLCVRNSVWLPQYGFELWSTFYLQRFGMDRDQLKNFLRCFNAGIRRRLVWPDAGADAPLTEALRRSAQFDRGIAPDMAAVAPYDGGRYTAAEAFWCGLFAVHRPRPTLPAIPDVDAGRVSESILLPITSCDRIAAADIELRAAVLAAFAIVLIRITGRDDAVLIVSDGGYDLPLRLYPGACGSFQSLATEAAALWREAWRHRQLAAHFLGNTHRLAHWGARPPQPDVSFHFGHASQARMADGRGLQLRALPRPEGLLLELDFLPDCLGQADAERLLALLYAILSAAGGRPETATRDIGEAPLPLTPTVAEDAVAEFNF